MAEPFTIYKLTILYMLDKAGFPLSNTQISNFFLEKEYTDYFRVQEVIGDLVNADLINFILQYCTGVSYLLRCFLLTKWNYYGIIMA